MQEYLSQIDLKTKYVDLVTKIDLLRYVAICKKKMMGIIPQNIKEGVYLDRFFAQLYTNSPLIKSLDNN